MKKRSRKNQKRQLNIFKRKDKSPMEFSLLYCPEETGSKLKSRIENAGGKVVDTIESTNTVYLVDKDSCLESLKIQKNILLCSLEFVNDSIKRRKRLNLLDYFVRLPLAKPIFSTVSELKYPGVFNDSQVDDDLPEDSINTRYATVSIGSKIGKIILNENDSTPSDNPFFDTQPNDIQKEIMNLLRERANEEAREEVDDKASDCSLSRNDSSESWEELFKFIESCRMTKDEDNFESCRSPSSSSSGDKTDYDSSMTCLNSSADKLSPEGRSDADSILANPGSAPVNLEEKLDLLEDDIIATDPFQSSGESN